MFVYLVVSKVPEFLPKNADSRARLACPILQPGKITKVRSNRQPDQSSDFCAKKAIMYQKY